MTVTIRDLAAPDAPGFAPLWQAYLAFYRVGLDPAVSARTWARLMDPESPVKARVAVDTDGRLLGFAIHHHHPSTWVMGDDCYLEDLFVADAARGQGIGRALIEDLIALSRLKGWHRLYWHTDEGNARARALYDSYASADGHVRYRIRV